MSVLIFLEERNEVLEKKRSPNTIKRNPKSSTNRDTIPVPFSSSHTKIQYSNNIKISQINHEVQGACLLHFDAAIERSPLRPCPLAPARLHLIEAPSSAGCRRCSSTRRAVIRTATSSAISHSRCRWPVGAGLASVEMRRRRHGRSGAAACGWKLAGGLVLRRLGLLEIR